MVLKNDLTGQRFGHITVLRYKGIKDKNKNRNSIWECVCDCDPDTILNIDGGNLLRGNTTKCTKCSNKSRIGSHRSYRLDLTNQTFGKLVVIKKLPNTGRDTHSRWQYRCSCGNIGEAYGHALTRGRQTQCRECKDKHQALKISGPNSNFWKGGISGEPKYCHKFNKRLKEMIREQYGRKCYVCDTTEEKLGRKLAVHHVDYNKVQGCKGMRWALIPLCPKCHAKTNHNRHFWFNLLYPRLIQDCVDNWGNLKVG